MLLCNLQVYWLKLTIYSLCSFFKFKSSLETTVILTFFSSELELENQKITLVILNQCNESKNISTIFFCSKLSCYLGDYRKGNSFCRFSHTIALKMIIVIKPPDKLFELRILNACKKDFMIFFLFFFAKTKKKHFQCFQYTFGHFYDFYIFGHNLYFKG